MRINRRPTHRSVVSLMRSSTCGVVKGIIHEEMICVWDAYFADHTTVAHQLGVDPNMIKPIILSHERDGVMSLDDPTARDHLTWVKWEIVDG